MSVVGIDYGSSACVIGVVRGGGIDIIMNEVSSRLTSAVVSFNEKQRAIGESGKTQFLRNLRSSVQHPKFLLGAPYADAALQARLPTLSGCEWSESPSGAAAKLRLRNQGRVFQPEQLNGALLGHLRRTCRTATGTEPGDVVLSVPPFWGSAQRQALLDAAAVGGLNVIGLISDMAAAALAWGFYRTEITDPVVVVFTVMGAAHFSAAAVEFRAGQAKVLAHASDATLGGDAIDLAIAERFAAAFQEKHGIDLRQNQRGWFKLTTAIERVKKNLNENERTSLGIECIVEDKDLHATLTRAEYLALLDSLHVRERVTAVLDAALAGARVARDAVSDVEWLGGGLRIVPVRDVVAEYFGGRRLSNTMNAEEGIARGCALYCALLSPLLKVRDYKVIDAAAHAITIAWDDQSTQLFARFSPLGKTVKITVPSRGQPLTVTLKYTNADEVLESAPADSVIAQYRVAAPPSAAEVALRVRLNANGIVSVAAAEYSEKQEVLVDVPVEAPKDAPKEAPKDAPQEEGSSDAAQDGEKAAKDAMEVDPPAPATRQETRIKTVTHPVPVEPVRVAGLGAGLAALVSAEREDHAADVAAEATATARNALEAAVYTYRAQLAEAWAEFATTAEVEALHTACVEAMDWLEGDGYDVTEQEYRARLATLSAPADQIRTRFEEWDSLPAALNALVAAIDDFRARASSGSEEYAHIDAKELASVVERCDNERKQLEAGDKLAAFASRSKTAAPLFRTVDLRQRLEILSKPKPAPKPATPPPAQPEPAPAPAAEPTQPAPADPMQVDPDLD